MVCILSQAKSNLNNCLLCKFLANKVFIFSTWWPVILISNDYLLRFLKRKNTIIRYKSIFIEIDLLHGGCTLFDLKVVSFQGGLKRMGFVLRIYKRVNHYDFDIRVSAKGKVIVSASKGNVHVINGILYEVSSS